MNAQDIFDGITDIRDDLVGEAKDVPKKKKIQWKKRWMGAAAAVLAAAVIGTFFLRPGSGQAGYVIAEAAYPEMAPYPDEKAYLKPNGEMDDKFDDVYNAWWEGVKAQRRELGDTTALQTFFARSAGTFLADTGGENRVYSPLNVYMALSMLAQLTDGESRGQILTLLGSGDMDTLRRQAGDVWNANYRDDGALTSILASSLWLNQDVKFNQDTMDILAEDFYASSYRGEPGTEEFNKALQSWLNEQTGGLLEEQAGNIELDSETILALASTVYFRARWGDEFVKENTIPQTFHAPDGDVEADFMRQEWEQTYYWGDQFAAVSQPFEEGGAMWFLLPDEGVRAEDLFADEEAMGFLFSDNRSEWEKQKFLIVHKSIPRFDVASQYDLGDGLRALGVTDVFDPAASDFTSMADGTEFPVFLSRANHAARVAIDEEGCTAAAFTVMETCGAAMPPDEEVDFVLDRPFIFVITGDSGLPMFVGVVNHPSGK